MKSRYAYLPDPVADWLDTLSPEQVTAILTDAYHEHQCGCTGQPGEIWQDEDGDLMMVTDEDCAETDTPAALYLTGPTAVRGGGR